MHAIRLASPNEREPTSLCSVSEEKSISKRSRIALTPAAVFCTPTEADADAAYQDTFLDGPETARGRDQPLFYFSLSLSLTIDRYKYDIL